MSTIQQSMTIAIAITTSTLPLATLADKSEPASGSSATATAHFAGGNNVNCVPPQR